MTTLLLDMDGPLADFDRYFWARCKARGYTFDVEHPDQQRHRFFTEHLPDLRERRQARAMVDRAGWFRSIPVTPGAVEGVAQLLELGVDVWVCTKPLEANPTCLNDKHAWLEDYFPALADRLICAPDKSMIRGDILLDDAPKPEWFPRAEWRPVLFDAPFTGWIEGCAGVPIWSWGAPVDRLLDPRKIDGGGVGSSDARALGGLAKGATGSGPQTPPSEVLHASTAGAPS